VQRDRTGADAGFEATALDPAITGAIDRLTKTVADVERIRGGLEPLLDKVREDIEARLVAGTLAGPTLLADAERLIEWLDRYAKTTLNLAKLTDETARLRSFVAGGADSRPDLSSMSDSQLAEFVRSGLAVVAQAEGSKA
jgi:hypothetical protein